MVVLLAAASLQGSTFLKTAVVASLLCVFFPWTQFFMGNCSGSLQLADQLSPHPLCRVLGREYYGCCLLRGLFS